MVESKSTTASCEVSPATDNNERLIVHIYFITINDFQFCSYFLICFIIQNINNFSLYSNVLFIISRVKIKHKTKLVFVTINTTKIFFKRWISEFYFLHIRNKVNNVNQSEQALCLTIKFYKITNSHTPSQFPVPLRSRMQFEPQHCRFFVKIQSILFALD